jgi:hypothetical protein
LCQVRRGFSNRKRRIVAKDWESTLRRWKNPPSDTEDLKRDRTEDEIREALRASEQLSNSTMSVYAKGSYKNNTNVRLGYDVDIAAEYGGFVFSDFVHEAAGLSQADVGRSAYTGDYSVEQFKDDVEEALVEAFGRRAVKRGNIAMRVRERSTTLPADVVPCFEYHLIHGRTPLGEAVYRQGHRVYPDSGSPVINYPQQQYENGVAKNTRTGHRYKHLVRILKNLENEIVEQGLIKDLPSYLVECLVFNVPDDSFGHPTYMADLRAVLATIFNKTMADDRCNDWVEVNDIKYLFRSSQPWTRRQAHEFADCAWDFVGFE